jgi:hypothetical protein
LFFFSCMKLSTIFTPSWTVWVLGHALLLGLGSCSTPITTHAPAQLLPAPTGGPVASTSSLAGSRLCQGFGTEWDSVLVVLPYTPPELVWALPVTNYQAIRGPVQEQRLDEGTCTLLMVKNRRYIAYSVFPRSVDWTTFSEDKAPHEQLVWLTKPDCARLVARFSPLAGDTMAWYKVGRANTF